MAVSMLPLSKTNDEASKTSYKLRACVRLVTCSLPTQNRVSFSITIHEREGDETSIFGRFNCLGWAEVGLGFGVGFLRRYLLRSYSIFQEPGLKTQEKRQEARCGVACLTSPLWE